jgi:hypothetical protein
MTFSTGYLCNYRTCLLHIRLYPKPDPGTEPPYVPGSSSRLGGHFRGLPVPGDDGERGSRSSGTCPRPQFGAVSQPERWAVSQRCRRVPWRFRTKWRLHGKRRGIRHRYLRSRDITDFAFPINDLHCEHVACKGLFDRSPDPSVDRASERRPATHAADRSRARDHLHRLPGHMDLGDPASRAAPGKRPSVGDVANRRFKPREIG